MAPPSFEFGGTGIAVLQSRNSLLELELVEKKKKISDLEAENQKLRKFYEKSRETIATVEKEILKGADEHRIAQLRKLQADNNIKHKMSEEALDKANSENRDLEEKLSQKERHYKILEDEAAKFMKEVEAEKEKVADRDARIKKLLEEETAREKYIKGVEEEAQGFQATVKQLERNKEQLETQLTQAREERDAVTEAKKSIEQNLHEKLRETEVAKSELKAANTDKNRLAEENARLLGTIADLQHVQSELAEEQELTAGLRDQVGRLGDELPRFDLDPQPHLTPAGSDEQPETPRTLANELEELGGSHESAAESDASTTKAFSEGSSPSSSDDEDEETGKADVIQVIKNVPGPTVHIYVPYQTFAHNPYTCWFVTEFNFVALFGCWLSWAAARVAPRLRKVSRTQNPDRSTPIPTQDLPNGAKDASLSTPTGNTDSPNATGNGTVPQRTSTASANGIAPQSSTMADNSNIPGPAPIRNGFPSQPLNVANNKIPITDTENGMSSRFRRARWWMPPFNPNNPPNALQTISAMILHLILYHFLWVCYSNCRERDLWIAANEATRVLLVDILALRSRAGRGLASHFFSEEVVRIIDRFILAAISLFNVEIKAYPIPG